MNFRKLVFGLSLCLLLIPAGRAGAQTGSDLGSWCSLMFVKAWEKPYMTARLEHRSFEKMSSTECWFAAVGAGYNFTKWLKADMGYEFWKIPSAGGVTVNKATLGVTASLVRDGLNVNIREKYEEAFSQDGSASGTLRSRLRAQYRIGSSRFSPYVMYEHFETIGTGWQRSLHYAGAEIRLADHHVLDLYYLYHLFPSGGATKGCNVLGVCYNLIF